MLDAVFVQFSLSPRIEITAQANRIVEIQENFDIDTYQKIPHTYSIPSCAHLLLLCCDGAMIQNFFSFVSEGDKGRKRQKEIEMIYVFSTLFTKVEKEEEEI